MGGVLQNWLEAYIDAKGIEKFRIADKIKWFIKNKPPEEVRREIEKIENPLTLPYLFGLGLDRWTQEIVIKQWHKLTGREEI